MLWDDTRIEEAAIHLECSGRSYFKSDYYVPLSSVKLMRDEYEAQLTAQSEWQPVANGKYGSVLVDGDQLSITFHDTLTPDQTDTWLPDNLRLCRLRTAAAVDDVYVIPPLAVVPVTIHAAAGNAGTSDKAVTP